MQQPESTMSLLELCLATGESERTLRYWVQFGLLSGPAEKGPAARYPVDHVARVAWIRHRQAEGVPLKTILGEVQRSERAAAGRPHTSPLPRVTAPAAGELLPPPAAHPSPIEAYLARANLLAPKAVSAVPQRVPTLQGLPASVKVAAPLALPDGTPPASQQAPQAASSEWSPPRTRWEHVMLDDGVELLVRRPLDTWRQRKVERLLRYAATLFANLGGSPDPADPDAMP